MFAQRQFTKQVSIVRAALSEAMALARDASYPQINFRPLQERLRELDHAYCRGDDKAVSAKMDAINGKVAQQLRAMTAHPAGSSVPSVTGSSQPGVRKTKAEAGKMGGESKSQAKKIAARSNGAKGGRPRKKLADS